RCLDRWERPRETPAIANSRTVTGLLRYDHRDWLAGSIHRNMLKLRKEGLSMRLRNPADYRTLLWVAMAAALVLLQFNWPQTVLYALPFSCYLAIACGTIAHNHNHCPTFDSKRANNVFGHVLTIFYG